MSVLLNIDHYDVRVAAEHETPTHYRIHEAGQPLYLVRRKDLGALDVPNGTAAVPVIAAVRPSLILAGMGVEAQPTDVPESWLDEGDPRAVLPPHQDSTTPWPYPVWTGSSWPTREAMGLSPDPDPITHGPWNPAGGMGLGLGAPPHHGADLPPVGLQDRVNASLNALEASGQVILPTRPQRALSVPLDPFTARLARDLADLLERMGDLEGDDDRTARERQQTMDAIDATRHLLSTALVDAALTALET